MDIFCTKCTYAIARCFVCLYQPWCANATMHWYTCTFNFSFGGPSGIAFRWVCKSEISLCFCAHFGMRVAPQWIPPTRKSGAVYGHASACTDVSKPTQTRTSLVKVAKSNANKSPIPSRSTCCHNRGMQMAGTSTTVPNLTSWSTCAVKLESFHLLTSTRQKNQPNNEILKVASKNGT